MITARTSRQAHCRPGELSDMTTDQWPDITKEPSDETQTSASCWAGLLSQESDQVSIQKASQVSQCRDEVGVIIASYESVH